MSAIDEILASLPIDRIADQVGASPDDVEAAAAVALPALLGGLDANAADPRGAASLIEALGQHENGNTDGVDLDAVDPGDGEKIARHIFGDQQDQVIAQLGGTGASSGLIKKLIPILAPIVLSYIANKMADKGASPSGGDQGVLGTVLEQVLKGAIQGSGGTKGVDAGSIIGDLLGGLLGAGRR